MLPVGVTYVTFGRRRQFDNPIAVNIALIVPGLEAGGKIAWVWSVIDRTDSHSSYNRRLKVNYPDARRLARLVTVAVPVPVSVTGKSAHILLPLGFVKYNLK
ncbi:hypothetical protein J6590_004529 [Homalodisca vitripennis]|nr:hypothetical protein J6590_004529 [Homalodisca vitripennis]